MEIKLRQIGDSQGIIIPKPFIKECGLGQNLNITIENKAIVLRPSFKHPRAGWAEAIAKELALNGPYEPTEEDLDFLAFPNDADKDWEW